MRGDNVEDDDGNQQSSKKGRISFASGSSQFHNTIGGLPGMFPQANTAVQLFSKRGRHAHFSTCQKKNVLRYGLVFHQIEAQDPGTASKTPWSQPASFSETTSTVLVKTSRAVYAPDIDCSLSRLTLISLVHLSHDLPIAFESFSCQLPQTFIISS